MIVARLAGYRSSVAGDAKERLRREKVRILLRTRNDAYPTLRAQGTPSTPAGPAPGRARKCQTCNGTGKIRVSLVCSNCEGRGKVSHDSYTGRVADSETRKSPSMSPERADAEIQRLGTSLRLSEGKIDPRESYGWERARERQNASGSYQELERILEALRSVHPIGWDFLMWVYGPLNPELSANAKKLEEIMVDAVAACMPSLIKVPAQEWEALKDRRRQRIKELSSEATPEEIADLVGLSLKTVQQILADSPS